MILRDQVTVTDTGLNTPASVQPLRSSEQAIRGVQVTALYRLTLPPQVALSSLSTLSWQGRSFSVEGDVEQWHRHGRLHHQEATIKAT